MPDPPPPKLVLHPRQRYRDAAERVAQGARRRAGRGYAELEVTSNFTFLTGASHPEELVQRSAELGQRAIGLTDTNSLAGVVRAHVAAKELGFDFRVGCRLVLDEAFEGEVDLTPPTLLVYPTDRASYGRLATLLTLGKRRAEKGRCSLGTEDVVDAAEGLLAVAVPPVAPGHPVRGLEAFEAWLARLREVFCDDRLSLAARALFGPDDRAHLDGLARLAARVDVPLVATNDVHHHTRERHRLQDVLVCIREGCNLEEAGARLFPNRERHLKPPEAMARLFEGHPEALDRTLAIAERAGGFSLDQLRYDYPHEVVDPGRTPMESLVARTWAGAAERYPEGVPDKVRRAIEHEFELIEQLGYAPYFLTVEDLVRFARSRGILAQGRGAAANSAVCYCLGITSVDPARIDLLFERFVSAERDEPPDIDVDFEHERREEAIQYLYRKYGRERAALTAEVITYRARSAVREVGKALGLSLDLVDRLAKDLDWWSDEVGQAERVRELGFDPDGPDLRRLFGLVKELLGFPRHLSQHVGGFVITEGPLCELVPIENAAMADRTVIEWDKDDIDALGILKVDVLGLGMLTCVRKAFELVDGAGGSGRLGGRALALHTVPPEDPEVYDMVCAADTVGVFQIESRAQMTMLPRLRPRCFYDLVIEVAIVRPGPIQGDMVHPYLRRRNGEERIEFPGPEVEQVLGKTLGVPLFQEQAMAVAIQAGGFTPGEADQLRRAMAAWKRKSTRLEELTDRLARNLLARGYGQAFCERFVRQLHGFSEYGFPESHAASFALIVYVSAWLKRWHPGAFCAALINSQPMGFYAPAQLVEDARRHGVEVRGVDVTWSRVDCTLEGATDGSAPDDRAGQSAVRLGLRLVKGLGAGDAARIEAAVTARLERGLGPFGSVETLWRASGVGAAALRKLAYAGAFGSLGLDRQQALWAVRALDDRVAGGPEQPSLWDWAAAGGDAVPAAGSNTVPGTLLLPGGDGVAEREAAGAGQQQGARHPTAPGGDGVAERGSKTVPGSSLLPGARDVAVRNPVGAGQQRGAWHRIAPGDDGGPYASDGSDGARPELPATSPLDTVLHDYAALELSLAAHPLAFLRGELSDLGAVTAAELADEERLPDGCPVAVAGIVLNRQRPGTASGIVFMTLEDETGTANLIVRPAVYERFRLAARHAAVLLVRGSIERAGPVVHVLAGHLERLDDRLSDLSSRSRDFR